MQWVWPQAWSPSCAAYGRFYIWYNRLVTYTLEIMASKPLHLLQLCALAMQRLAIFLS